MDPYVIGIDLGTGSAKALAVTQMGVVADHASVAYPTTCPRPGYQEQAPELIWQAFVKCVSRITGNMKQSPAAICLGSAMHSVVPLDRDGKPLMNMMIWADNRSAGVATRIRRSATAEMLYEQTGTPIHAMSPLCKIAWLKENQRELFQKTAKFVSIKEYVWMKLFSVYEVDYSIASATGLFDIEKTALEKQIATPVIALSLLMRYRSLEEDTFSGKIIAALRNEFGGHAVVGSR